MRAVNWRARDAMVLLGLALFWGVPIRLPPLRGHQLSSVARRAASTKYNKDMRQRIDAIYEDGLLRPLEPLQLSDRERVSVTVESAAGEEWLDEDALQWARQEGDPTISLDEVRRRLASGNGSLSDVVIAERGEY